MKLENEQQKSKKEKVSVPNLQMNALTAKIMDVANEPAKCLNPIANSWFTGHTFVFF